MSGKNVEEIVVGANGAVWVAPLTAELPEHPTAPLGNDYLNLGYLNEDGVKQTDGKTVNAIMVWQMFYPARRIVTEREFMVAFMLRQWSQSTFPLAFGGGDIEAIDGYDGMFRYSPPPPEYIDERIMVVDWVDGIRNYRVVMPRGMVTENVETNIMRTAAADLPITFAINGQEGQDPWYLLTDDPAFAPAA